MGHERLIRGQRLLLVAVAVEMKNPVYPSPNTALVMMMVMSVIVGMVMAVIVTVFVVMLMVMVVVMIMLMGVVVIMGMIVAVGSMMRLCVA
jgi:hypothetical protein